MNHIFFFIFIFFFLFLIMLFQYFYYYYYSNTLSQEPFQTSKTILLVGDSIFKNNAYVSDQHSVEQILQQKHRETFCFAEDHATISDIYSQLDQIPLRFNQPHTFLFLSIGGNNIIRTYVDQQNDITDTKQLDSMVDAYKELLKSIRTRFPLIQIILLDIYYPHTLQYKPFHSIIRYWNEQLHQNIVTTIPNAHLLKISEFVTQEDDFIFGYEPSINGGKKIAHHILHYSSNSSFP